MGILAALLCLLVSVSFAKLPSKRSEVTDYHGVEINRLEKPKAKQPQANSFTYPTHGYPPDQVALGITGAIAAMFFNPLMMGLAGVAVGSGMDGIDSDQGEFKGPTQKAMFFVLNATFGGLYWGLKYIVLMWGNPWMAMVWSSVCNIFWLTAIVFCMSMVLPTPKWAPATVGGAVVLNGIVLVCWITFVLMPPEW